MRILKMVGLTIFCLAMTWLVIDIGFKWRFQKPEAILLVDIRDFDAGGKERISDWLENNDELKKNFDFRAVITVNADLSSFNPFQFYEEVETKLGAKNLIHATMPDMTLGLYFSSVFFTNKNMFSAKTEKNLIILSTYINKSQELTQELKDFRLDNPEIKIKIAALKETIPKKRKLFPFKRISENFASAETELRSFC